MVKGIKCAILAIIYDETSLVINRINTVPEVLPLYLSIIGIYIRSAYMVVALI